MSRNSLRLALTSIFALTLILYVVSTFVFTPQAIMVVGKVELESFDPTCRETRPPCALPSLSAPILVTNISIYVLTSNDSSVMQQIYSFQGKFVQVNGIARHFNASSVYAAHNCSPYPCSRIANELFVVSIQPASTTEMSPSSLSIILKHEFGNR